MALGDLVATRFSQSTAASVSNHLDDYAVNAEFRNPVAAEVTATATTTTSNYSGDVNAENNVSVYLPQMIVFCEFRHEAFEISVPTGPAENGLVSKWRPRERVSKINLRY